MSRLWTGKGARLWICFDKSYGVLRTCLNTQTARPALIRIWRIRNPSAVNPIFELRHEPQICVVGGFDFSNFEYVVRANLSARPLRFTPRKIHDWHDFALRLFTDLICHLVAPADRDHEWFAQSFRWLSPALLAVGYRMGTITSFPLAEPVVSSSTMADIASDSGTTRPIAATSLPCSAASVTPARD